MTPALVGERHCHVAQSVRRALTEHEVLKDFIAMLGIEKVSPQDRETVTQARRLDRFQTQPFFTIEQFTQGFGASLGLDDTLEAASPSGPASSTTFRKAL